MENISKRMEELINILEQANYDYYVLDKPTLEDWQFDSYMQELISLEEKYPMYAFSNSPTKRVGGSVASGFIKVTHARPMMSLGNVFNEEEILDFDRKVKEIAPHATYLCELKIDGLSGSIVYEGGEFTLGATRGNGVVGENISQNVNEKKS